MHHRYPIPGIKQTYRRNPGGRTIVIPVLMGATMLGIIAFFFWTEPVVEFDPASIPEVVVEDTVETAARELPSITEFLVSEETSLSTGNPFAVAENERVEIPGTIETAGIDDQKFTPWLSPEALDQYIREKNRGFEESFWERGHWIKAVEGRWAEGDHQFRIAYEPIPNPDSWQWQYRVNQTQSSFAASIREMSERGFKLRQTQSYERPDGERRFQGVWQREIKDLPSMVGNATESSVTGE